MKSFAALLVPLASRVPLARRVPLAWLPPSAFAKAPADRRSFSGGWSGGSTKRCTKQEGRSAAGHLAFSLYRY